MKIFAGIVLLVIGLGIGYGIYNWASKGAQQMLSFSVSLDGQSNLTLTIGIPASGENSSEVQVSVQEIGDYDQNVNLSTTGEPTGVSTSFSPLSGTPTFGSTLTITVDNTATSGSTTLTVKAIGEDGTESTATLKLTLV